MRRKRTQQDSLELFLDAICNMFGGFVFIMLFVVVSIRSTIDAKTEEMREQGTERVSQAEIDALNEQLKQLEIELQKLSDDRKETIAFAESLVDKELLEKYKKTLETLEKVQALQVENEKTQELVDDSNEKLEQAKKDLEAVKADFEVAVQDCDDAEKALEDIKKKRVRTTSPPKLHAVSKTEVPLIVRFGRVYFWHKYGRNGELTDNYNSDDFIFHSRESHGVIFTTHSVHSDPKPWRGLDLEDPDVDMLLMTAFQPFRPDSVYFTIVVDNDSFTEYNVLSAFLKRRGYDINPWIGKEGAIVVDRGGNGHTAQ